MLHDRILGLFWQPESQVWPQSMQEVGISVHEFRSELMQHHTAVE